MDERRDTVRIEQTLMNEMSWNLLNEIEEPRILELQWLFCVNEDSRWHRIPGSVC